MAYTYLEFEKPISDLENKIENLETSTKETDVSKEISELAHKLKA